MSDKREILRKYLWPELFVLVMIMLSAGCQQQMADQPSYKSLQPCDFFDDGRSARPVVPGTVARGYLRVDRAFFTGQTDEAAPAGVNGRTSSSPAAAPDTIAATERSAGGFEEERRFVDQFPMRVTKPVLSHGYNRYMIYCVVCHDPLGTGRGKIIERGYTSPPSFHIDRLRSAPVGRLFAIVSEGYGSMPAYGKQIPVPDRWAIIAYIRALQLSQHFAKEDMTSDMQAALAPSTELSAPLEELLPSKEALR